MEDIDFDNKLESLINQAEGNFKGTKQNLLKMIDMAPNRTKEKKFKQKVENAEDSEELIAAIKNYAGGS